MDENKLTNFILKLWSILEDQSLRKVICWDMTGKSFHIIDVYGFCEIVLPRFFKHKNIASFVRQLNLYGFKKVATIDRSTHSDSFTDCMQFAHPYFIRDNPQLMTQIKRNCSTGTKRLSNGVTNTTNNNNNNNYHRSLLTFDHTHPATSPLRDSMVLATSASCSTTKESHLIECQADQSASTSASLCVSAIPAITGGGDRLIAENGEQMLLIGEDELNGIVNELHSLRIGQSNLHNKIGDLSRENEILWNEMGLLREVCERQRQSVSKLVQFLLTLVQPNGAASAHHHHQKHCFNHNATTTKAKRLVPFIESSAAAILENAAQLDNTNFPYTTNNGVDADGTQNGEAEMAIAAPHQLSSILATAMQARQPMAMNWDILSCIQKDILSQENDYLTMSVMHHQSPPSPPTPPLSTATDSTNDGFLDAISMSNSTRSRQPFRPNTSSYVPRPKFFEIEPFNSYESSIKPLRITERYQKPLKSDYRRLNPNIVRNGDSGVYRRLLTNYDDYNDFEDNFSPCTDHRYHNMVKREIRPTYRVYSSDEPSNSLYDTNFDGIDANRVVVLSPANSDDNNCEPSTSQLQETRLEYSHRNPHQLALSARAALPNGRRNLYSLQQQDAKASMCSPSYTLVNNSTQNDVKKMTLSNGVVNENTKFCINSNGGNINGNSSNLQKIKKPELCPTATKTLRVPFSISNNDIQPITLSSSMSNITPAKRMRNNSFVQLGERNNRQCGINNNELRQNRSELLPHHCEDDSIFVADNHTDDVVDDEDDDFYNHMKTAAEAIERGTAAPLEFDVFTQLNGPLSSETVGDDYDSAVNGEQQYSLFSDDMLNGEVV